jgi:hypothetical protein
VEASHGAMSQSDRLPPIVYHHHNHMSEDNPTGRCIRQTIAAIYLIDASMNIISRYSNACNPFKMTGDRGVFAKFPSDDSPRTQPTS